MVYTFQAATFLQSGVYYWQLNKAARSGPHNKQLDLPLNQLQLRTIKWLTRSHKWKRWNHWAVGDHTIASFYSGTCKVLKFYQNTLIPKLKFSNWNSPSLDKNATCFRKIHHFSILYTELAELHLISWEYWTLIVRPAVLKVCFLHKYTEVLGL